jgi:hypothetical protein
MPERFGATGEVLFMLTDAFWKADFSQAGALQKNNF